MNLNVEKKYTLELNEREARALKVVAQQFTVDDSTNKMHYPESWELADTLGMVLP